MRPEAKRLKLTGIATMFVGIIVAVIGIVLTVRGGGLYGAAVIVCGILGAFIGVRGSLAANVPSTAGKVLVPSVICGLVCVILAFVCFAMRQDSLSYMLGCVIPGVFSAIVGLNGQVVVKELEKI